MKYIRAIFKLIARKLGIEIVQLQPISEEYEPVRPQASYSPWKRDSSFQKVFTAVQEHTLVDMYRCFELWALIEQVAKLEKGSIIEIGVWRGGTGALIAKQAINCGIKEKVYLCDTFKGVVKAGEMDTTYKGGEHSDTSRKLVEDLVYAQLKLENVEILEGVFPNQTAHKIENQQFRFCHVDVDVYNSAKDIDNWIWDKLVRGGIIVYDDYGFKGCDGIRKYVNEQMKLSDRLVVHNLNGHAIVLKL